MSDPSSRSAALEQQIYRQPEELAHLLDEPIPHETIERLRQAHRIWLVGTGTSQHAAELGAGMLHEAGRAAHAMSSASFVGWAPPIDPRDALVLISHNAGVETAYAGSTWTIAIHAGLRVVPITRRGGAMPGAIETVDKEASQTYTVSYTTALLVLARLAHALGVEAFDPPTLARIPEAVRAALADPGTQSIEPPARLLVLAGEGPAAVTAREGALKLREASRLPAEGYEAEYLLHGNAVPLGGDDHLLVLTPPDADGLVAAVAHAAEAVGIAVTTVHEPADLPPLLAQIPLTARLQLLALRLSRARNLDGDVVIEGAWVDEGLWAIGSPESRRT